MDCTPTTHKEDCATVGPRQPRSRYIDNKLRPPYISLGFLPWRGHGFQGKAQAEGPGCRKAHPACPAAIDGTAQEDLT